MKFTTILVAVALYVALVSSSPVPQDEGLRSQALDQLVMVEGDNEEALRSKRTIGVLRQLFPGISQIVEQQVNAITSEIIRILGPIVLRGVLGNGAGGGGTGGTSGSKSSEAGTTVELALPDDADDDDSSSTSQGNARVSISLPTFPPDEDDDATQPTTATSSTTTTTTSAKPSIQNRKRRKRHVEWKRSTRDVNPEAEDRLIEDTAESQNNEVRVQFADDQSGSAANEAVESELAPLEDIEVSDDENRNKRFLNFGFGASGGAGAAAGANAGGSGGGSGNFLFDIIRLVAGSGSSQATDVAAGAPSPGGTAEAVPGPVTRLFVIANRGISNLIQDLILRLAATSERIVNFKARLITSII